MIDASHAIANTVKRLFPECKILMCWFHLKLNIRKHKKKIPNQLYRKTMDDLNQLHGCACEGSYKVNKLLIFFNHLALILANSLVHVKIEAKRVEGVNAKIL